MADPLDAPLQLHALAVQQHGGDRGRARVAARAAVAQDDGGAGRRRRLRRRARATGRVGELAALAVLEGSSLAARSPRHAEVSQDGRLVSLCNRVNARSPGTTLSPPRPAARVLGPGYMHADRRRRDPAPAIASWSGSRSRRSRRAARCSRSTPELQQQPDRRRSRRLAATCSTRRWAARSQHASGRRRLRRRLSPRSTSRARITGDTGARRVRGNLIHRAPTVATAEGRVIAEDTGKLSRPRHHRPACSSGTNHLRV